MKNSLFLILAQEYNTISLKVYIIFKRVSFPKSFFTPEII